MPQVYARERLVTERVRELQWLNTRLEKPFEQGTQGRLSTSDVDRLRFAANANIKGALDLSGVPSTSSTTLDATTADPLALSAEDLSLSPIQQLQAEEAYRGEVLSSIRRMSLDDSHDLNGRRMVEFTLNAGVIPTKDESRYALITVDLCEKAKGTFKPAELRGPIEGTLDEIQRHAQQELEFDLAYVFEDLEDVGGFFRLKASERAGQESSESSIEHVERRLHQIPLPFAVPRPAVDSKSSEDASSLEQMLASEVISQAMDDANQWWSNRRQPGVRTPSLQSLRLARAASFIATSLNDIDDSVIRWRLDPPEADQTDPQLTIRLRDEGWKKFQCNLGTASDGASAFTVTDVEPAQSSQTWDLAAVRDVQRELSLGASFGDSTLGLSSAMDRLQRSLSSARSPTQIPAVIGFGSSSTSASWLLCPTDLPQGKASGKGTRIHRPTRHNLTLRAVIPVNCKIVQLTATYQWIGKDGKLEGGPFSLYGSVDSNGQKAVKDPNSSCIDVEVPPDLPAISSWLLYSVRGNRRPVISYHQGELREGFKNQTLLIQGRDLWRSPQVFLGGRQATRVELVPDMSGLVATFDEVILPWPQESGADSTSLPLRVITSTGEAVDRYSVTIYRSSQPAAFAKVVDDPAKPVIGKGVVSFEVDPELTPTAFSNIVLTLRKDPGSAYQHLTVPRRVVLSGGKRFWNFEVTADQVKKVLGSSTGRGEVGLLLVPEPGADPIRVPRDKSASNQITWFPNAAASQPRWSETELVFNGTVLTKGGNPLTSLTVEWPSPQAKAYQGARTYSGKQVLWQQASDLSMTVMLGDKSFTLEVEAAQSSGGDKTVGAVSLDKLNAWLKDLGDKLASKGELKAELLSSGQKLPLGTALKYSKTAED